MTAVGFAGIENEHDELIRKAIKGGVWISDTTTDEITTTNIFDPTSGGLVVLPDGYKPLGRITDAGVAFSRKVTETDLAGWGTNDPVRSDITADTLTVKFDAMETNAQNIALYTGVDLSTITPDGTNGSFEIPIPTDPSSRFFRMLALGVDGSPGAEYVQARFFPRCKITDYDDQTFANGKDGLLWGATYTAYKDDAFGYSQKPLFGGEALNDSLTAMGFSRVVTCTTATTTALVATTGHFFPDDVGALVSATSKITPGTTIVEVTDSTHAVMSAVGLASGTAIAVTITPA